MGKLEKLSVEIPAELLDCAKSAVAGGEFASVEQVIDAALRSWMIKRDAELARIRGLLEEGIASGFEPWDGVEGIIAEGRRGLAERKA